MMLDAPMAAGDTLHLWLMPVGAAQALVALSLEGVPLAILSGEPSAEFSMRSHVCAAAGTLRAEWDAATTTVSLAYAFAPARVLDEGVRVLFTTARNAPPDDPPRFHFQPRWGWMNDPNGLCEVAGRTHLFYQHYPHSLRWNTMHWGHATSRDGVSWAQQPIFLTPRDSLLGEAAKKGGAFSGSCLPQGEGVRVFYTDREDDRVPEWEWQMTATSADMIAAGASTPIISARPAVPGIGKDFRDPYVFRGPDGRVRLLLGANDDTAALVLLYATDDATGATGWRFSGVLHREPRFGGIPAECPSLIALDGEGEGLWALFVGYIGSRDKPTGRRNISLATIGRFDGTVFAPVAERELDFGTACYAFQVFPTAQGPRGIGWAANWTDVSKDRDFPSAMTLIRSLVWRDGALLMPPAPGTEALRGAVLSAAPSQAPEPVAIPDGAAELLAEFAAPGSAFSIVLQHPTAALSVSYDGTTLELHHQPTGQRAAPHYRCALPELRDLRLFIDAGVVELYANDGAACATRRIEPGLVTALEFTAAPGAVAHETLWAIRA